MRHRLASALVAIAAFSLGACGPTVAIQRAPDVRIEPGARWAFGPPDRDGVSAAEGGVIPDDSIAAMIRASIDAELTARGFVRTSVDSAAYIVHWHVGQRRVTDTLPPRDDRTDGTRAPGNWGGYGRPEELQDRLVEWEEGMLIVDAVHAERGVVAWRGLIAGEIPERATVRPRDAIREAVRRLLRDFP